MAYGEINIYIAKNEQGALPGGQGQIGTQYTLDNSKGSQQLLESSLNDALGGGTNYITVNNITNVSQRNTVQRSTNITSALFPIIKNYVTKSLNEGINVYGELTGDMVGVNKAQTFLNIASNIALASSGVVGLVAVAYNTSKSIIEKNIHDKKANEKAMFLSQGLGKITNNYGRYY